MHRNVPLCDAMVPKGTPNSATYVSEIQRQRSDAAPAYHKEIQHTRLPFLESNALLCVVMRVYDEARLLIQQPPGHRGERPCQAYGSKPETGYWSAPQK